MMYETNLRDEILQSTQRLMDQIDLIKPVEINPEEIEKSHAFLQSIDDEQISNIEKSHSLLRDVSSWGDRRIDQYNQFEKPLLNTVEKSVYASEEVTRSAIPLLQEKIDNYDRQLGNIKSSIVTMSDAITKTAKETYEMAKSGNDPNIKINSDPSNEPVLLAFTSSSFSLQEKKPNEETTQAVENSEETENKNSNIISKDDKTNYDIFQKMKAREEHLLNVIKSMSDQQTELENSLKAEQINSKNLQFQIDYIKKSNYTPELMIDEDSQISTSQYKSINITQNSESKILYEIPYIPIIYSDKNEDTKELEKEIEISTQKIISIQNFDIFSIESSIGRMKNELLEDHQKEYRMNLIDQGIQHSNNTEYDFKNIQTEQIGPIENTVAIIKGEDDHHIFAFPENLNQDDVADDVNDLINFHRSNQDNSVKENEEEEINEINDEEIEQEIRLKNLKMINDFKHAADVVFNTKTDERYILTEDNIRLDLTKQNNQYEFTSKNGQTITVDLIDRNDQQLKENSNLQENEVLENQKIILANETNNNNEKVELEVIINKSGESFISNNNIDKIFMDEEGRTFIFDSTGKNKVYVLMNEEGKIVYETRNGQMIQIAMQNMNPDFYFINEDGEQIPMKIDQDGNFYILSKNGQRIVIDFNSKSETNIDQNPIDKDESNDQSIKEKSKLDEQIINKLEERLSRPTTTSTSTELLVPVSISRKGNEMKIIYKDCQDAVVVNTTISHMTEDGQIILNHDQKSVKTDGKSSNDHYTRITRILGGFERSFMNQSRRKNFNWSLAPIGELSVEGSSYSSIVKLTNSKLGSRAQNGSTYEIQQSDTAIRWRSFPIRPPPPCCRKLQTQLEMSYPSKKNSPMPLISLNRNKSSVVVPIDPIKRKNFAAISSYENSPRRQRIRSKVMFPSNVLLDVSNPLQMMSNLSPRLKNQKVSENHVSNSQNVSIAKIDLPQAGF